MKWRTIECAKYTIEHNSTVRDTAKALHISKSTVHKDLTERLILIDKSLYQKVKKILEINLNERHIRGGNATKLKYEKKVKEI